MVAFLIQSSYKVEATLESISEPTKTWYTHTMGYYSDLKSKIF